MAAGAGIGAAVGHNTRSALIGAGAGAAAGGLITHFATRPSQPAAWRQATSVELANQMAGQVILVSSPPPPPPPLDCKDPKVWKKHKAACEAADALAAQKRAEAQAEAERQKLASSPWRLYNRSGFTVDVFDGGKRLGQMRPNQSWRVLEPEIGFRAVILAPDFSGSITKHEARIRPANDFQGWVITSPKVEEE
jgi:hypothetical protein